MGCGMQGRRKEKVGLSKARVIPANRGHFDAFYEKLTRIGRGRDNIGNKVGGYGEVWKVKDIRSGTQRAAKIIKIDNWDDQQRVVALLQSECEVLRKLVWPISHDRTLRTSSSCMNTLRTIDAFTLSLSCSRVKPCSNTWRANRQQHSQKSSSPLFSAKCSSASTTATNSPSPIATLSRTT